MNKLSIKQKLRSSIAIIIGAQLTASGYLTYRGDQKWYRDVLMPFLQIFGGEQAHWLAVKLAKYGIVPRIQQTNSPRLTTVLWHQRFDNPIGLAAGFDKHGECVDSMFKIGFGLVEVGSVTPEPQVGNTKPRVFRLKDDRAVINRYGFNSDGHEVVYRRLKDRVKVKQVLEAPDNRNMLNENLWSPDRPTVKGFHRPARGVLGVNLGKNKDSPDAVADYVAGVKKFGELADYLVINVSSPNTPGLRAMQGRQILQELVSKVTEERDSLTRKDKPPLLVKIAPDLTEQDKIDIAAVVARPASGIDGLIISNTTVSRPESLSSHNKTETGGLSGAPLRDLSTQCIRDMYRLTMGRVPIVGVGGISTGQDAFEKVKAGASLVQLYTVMSFEGPPIVNKIKTELDQILEKEGFASISDAVGVDFKSGFS